MMEISRNIQGTPTMFFDCLWNALVEDVEQNVPTVLHRSKLKEGFHYQKQLKNKLGKSGNVRVEITKLKEPFAYGATFSSAQGMNTLSYCAEILDDDHIKVTYGEDFISPSKSKTMNYKIMSKLYKRSSIRKANLMLDRLEQYMKK